MGIYLINIEYRKTSITGILNLCFWKKKLNAIFSSIKCDIFATALFNSLRNKKNEFGNDISLWWYFLTIVLLVFFNYFCREIHNEIPQR